MRMEWELDKFLIPREKISEYFNTLYAAKHQMQFTIFFREQKPRMALFVSKMSHCFYDIMARYTAGEWDVEIPLIISNHEDLRPAAERFGIPYHVFPITKDNKAELEPKEMELLEQNNILYGLLLNIAS